MESASFSADLGANYELLGQIGTGASGVVWRARDKHTNDIVAAKVLREEHVHDLDLVTRFVKERNLLINMRDEHIVEVKDLIVEGSRLAIIMEYVNGVSLRDVLHSGNLKPAEAVTITLHVLEGLKAAHKTNVIHRDVKPDNILLTRGWQKGKPGSIKLTDFGISRLITEGHSTSTTLVGTPEYLPPELIERGEASYPADVYSTGIMLYELLAGRTPFASSGIDFTILHRHATAEVPPIPVRSELWDIVIKMLEKRPHMRLDVSSAIEKLEAIEDIIKDDLPIALQSEPEEFLISYGPATVLRASNLGSVTNTSQDDEAETAPDDTPAVMPDLGEATSHTVLRPQDIASQKKPAIAADEGESSPHRKISWKITLYIILGMLAVVCLIIGVVLAGGSIGNRSADTKEPLTSVLEGEPLPSGLLIDREARFDAEKNEIRLSITYQSENTPLSGPFFERVAFDGECADIQWNIPDQVKNISAQTFIEMPCGWALHPGKVDRKATVEGTINLGEASLTQEELDAWLKENAEQTAIAMSDKDVSSSAYPAQRVQGFSVKIASRVLSGDPVDISLLPIWPGGTDELNPIYVSPHAGQVTSIFSAIAGDESHLRLVDGCAGAISVSRDGLTATALRPANECTIYAQLGNFQEVASNTFEIVGHDS